MSAKNTEQWEDDRIIDTTRDYVGKFYMCLGFAPFDSGEQLSGLMVHFQFLMPSIGLQMQFARPQL